MGIPNIFTLEASFCGCENAGSKGCHMTSGQLMQIGRDLCRSLISGFDVKFEQTGNYSPGKNCSLDKIGYSPDRKFLYYL